ncbi:MAG: hypothetical protein VB102_12015 [Paludibacter sp.]|nr:hypothetical protein [Paludibacter sp.]
MSNPKNKYSIIVFLESGKPKKWQYVHKLNGMAMYLNKMHPTWQYFNVYDRRSGQYLKRFKRNDFVPDFI